MSYPKPASSWIFDEILEDWIPPAPKPIEDGSWAWSEPNQEWELIIPPHAGINS